MPTIRCICLSLALLSLTSLASQLPAASSTNELVVFTAKKIITMEPAMPEATAVAVSEGRIVAVGSLESLASWRDAKGARIDRRFADKVIMPGFIDPHVHPSLPADINPVSFYCPGSLVTANR